MILKNGTFDKLATEIIQKDYSIIIFGAGVIGTVTTPALLKEHHIESKVGFYVDNDENKWGKFISLSDREVNVFSADCLRSIDVKRSIILLTTSRFSESLHQLESFENLKNAVCYIIPMMCISNFKPLEEDGTRRDHLQARIPKIIHYMWLGKRPLPDALQYCINSWKKHCSDYEICCWDESNYDINKNVYMKEAYKKGLYGFVPDYARLDILYTYGGIYMDTDVELIRNLDDMLYQDGFCCVEKWQTINFGGGSGAVKGNKAIYEMIKSRENLKFIDENGNFNKNTCGYYDTLALKEAGYELNGKVQKVMDLNIYPYEYFHPYDYMSGKTDVTKHTYGIHHFNGGWLEPKMKQANKKATEEFEKVFALANKNTVG